MSFSNPTEQQIKQILQESKVIAVVGLSPKPDRTSYQVAQALQDRGYRILPVNPVAAGSVILGERCLGSLGEAGESIDIVNVFRRSELTVPVAEEAAKVRARTIWLQLGIYNEQAAQIAERAGLRVIMDRCIKVDAARLL